MIPGKNAILIRLRKPLATNHLWTHPQAMKKLIIITYALSVLATTLLSSCAHQKETTTTTTSTREEAVTAPATTRTTTTRPSTGY